ncbi:hypothetical protein ACWEWD_39755 [Streptomyces tendae]|uniref:hypothetical protein n=1 Tax=Streptomyces sp. H23 TaxID=2541723 RepID=UPI00106E5385|nr:hypothetical protein [Streptomyces sp. H23]
MSNVTSSSASGDGPGEPRRFVVALAGGYVAGYSAALGVGAGQSLSMTMAQGAAAAFCWIFWRHQRK